MSVVPSVRTLTMCVSGSGEGVTEVTPLTSRIFVQQVSSQKLVKETSMQIDAGRENSERPTRSETDLRPPKWLARIVEALVPPELGSPNELIGVLLETHGSIAQTVLHIPVAIAPPALGRARDAFYWKMAMAQTAILFLPFVDILSLPIVLNLGLVLAVLIIREGYIHKTDRTECEAITSFMTPALIIFFNAALGC